ncbi:PREDICTED: maltase 2-like [Vollenhovia emeryi]|uniref:maltase 2-like n=1 Tax=Vollenhovia emeryi TaxID=411798 RepID=UPI0005F478A3|nr:PREDICTED: maltase 2-like [Vollenhovia emeryi]
MKSGRDRYSIGGAEDTSSSSPVVATFRSRKGSAAERGDDPHQPNQLQNNAVVVMGKQNGEDLDQDAQERMLKEDSTAKISIEKDDKNEKAPEVRISSSRLLRPSIPDSWADETGHVRARTDEPRDFYLLSNASDDPRSTADSSARFLNLKPRRGRRAGAYLISLLALYLATDTPISPLSRAIDRPRTTTAVSRGASNRIILTPFFLNPNFKARHRIASRRSANVGGRWVDFKDIKPYLGNVSDLENFIKVAKEKDQQIFLDLDPNHSSVEHPWFKQSVAMVEPYTSYYVWRDGKFSTEGGRKERSPPNNWLSVYGGSAWEWNEQRRQYYLHQFNKSQPDLNYNNSAVVAEFGDVLTYWLKLGISGFRLANTQYLTEDPNFRDEKGSLHAIDSSKYQSLSHVYTRDRTENAAILSTWQEIVRNETAGKGLFSLQDDIGVDILQVYNDKMIIDLPQSSHFLTTANASINATDLRKSITQWLGVTPWPAWNVNGKQRSLRQRMPKDVADSIVLMTMLLPGTPILRLDDVMSAKDAFAILSSARSGLTFLHGNTTLRIVNGTVFVYARSWLKSGNPGYLVAYQTANEPAVINLSGIPRISEEINVVAHSPNYVQNTEVIKTKLPSAAVPISPKSTLILTFVPKES